MVTAQKRLLLLIDPSGNSDGEVREWLIEKGFIAWEAQDFSHALEELSDFTVKKRPDVVLLEASPIAECLDHLRDCLCDTVDCDVSVLALSGKRTPSSNKFFARDLDQLERLIGREGNATSATV